VRLAQAREEHVRARNANALAVRVLRNLLGIEGGDFEVADTAPAATAPDSGDFSGRPELAAARHREQAAQQQAHAAKGGYLPRVNAFGSADYDYGWTYNNGGGSYTAGALLQWDLWDGKMTRAKLAEANANVELAREEQRKLHLALDLEAEQARLDLKAANERLSVTDQVVAQATESASLTRARFEQDLALSTQLIDAAPRPRPTGKSPSPRCARRSPCRNWKPKRHRNEQTPHVCSNRIAFPRCGQGCVPKEQPENSPTL
jgi:outer membrane protein TolC